MTLQEVWELVQRGGLLAGAMVILWGGLREKAWWVSGREFRELQHRCSRLEEIALRGTSTSERAVEVARRVTELGS